MMLYELDEVERRVLQGQRTFEAPQIWDEIEGETGETLPPETVERASIDRLLRELESRERSR